MSVVLLEQTRPSPAWWLALEVAMALPSGVPERRANEDPWATGPGERPRRATDDLAWLRQAIDEPGAMGLTAVDDEDARVRVWEIGDPGLTERLERLLARGILEAAGFHLHRADRFSQ